MLLSLSSASATNAWIGLRDLTAVTGRGGGSLFLLPVLRTGIHTMRMKMMMASTNVGNQGGTTLVCPIAIDVGSNNTSPNILTFVTKGLILVRSPPHIRGCGVINLHKREKHSDSQTKCCFASPVSERTAFACFKRPEKFPVLQNYSTILSSSSIPNLYGLTWPLRSILGFSLIVEPRRVVNTSYKNYLKLSRLPTFISPNVTRYLTKMANGNGSLARQNFHEDCEANINKQINMELYASYVYMSMAYYFDREDVALPGFSKFFKKNSDEEREHAEKFMKYQNQRGGRIVLQPIAKPTQDEWTSALEAVQAALDLEKTVNQTLLDLHVVAGKRNDPQLCDFLETNFLEEQVHAIKELAEMVTKLKRVGTGLGEYLFDKDLGCE